MEPKFKYGEFFVSKTAGANGRLALVVNGFTASGRQAHGVNGYAVIDPAGGVAGKEVVYQRL